MKNKLKRALGILLVFVTMFSLYPVQEAQAVTPTGNHTGQGLATGGSLQAPGVLVGIRKIENTTLSEYEVKVEKEKEASSDNTSDLEEINGGVGYLLYDKYYKQAPETVTNAGVVNSYALVARPPSYNFNFPSRDNYYVFGCNDPTDNTFNKVYEVNRNTDYEKYTPWLVSSLMSSTYKTKFENRTLTWNDMEDIIEGKESVREAAMNSLIANLAETGNVSQIYDGSGSDRVKKEAEYYDLLWTVNKLCGYKYTPYLKEFLKTRNDSSEEFFYVIEMIAVISLKDSSNGNMYWYSYPTFMASMTSKSISTFMNYKNAKHNGTTAYGTTEASHAAFKTIDLELEKSLYSKVTDTSLKNVYDWAWYDEWSARYSLMMRDLDGYRTWASGYTYIADFGEDTTHLDPKGEVKVSVKPKSQKVESGSASTASIYISLETGEDKVADDKKVFNEYAKKGIYPKVTITMTFEAKKGSGTSDDPYDQLVTDDGWTLSSSNKLTKTFTTWSSLNKYLTGEKYIELADTDIKITEKTVNLYKANVVLYWDDDKQYEFDAKGKDKSYKTGKTAADSASWLVTSVTVTPEPGSEEEELITTGSYYSEIETPYVEIKEGSPNNETYEAMAGVPTTENLYVGFGATEFMTNIEVEKKEAPTSTRTYTLTYASTQCTENNVKCTITCPGHTTATHMVTPAVPATATSPGSPAVYCTAGHCGAGGTATCSCGKSTVKCPNNGKSMCTWNNGAEGCVHNQVINQAHPHTHVWTGIVTQPIDEFTYLDITGMDLWQLNRCILEGNEDLFSNPLQTINPNTGYRAFYNQEGYSNNNGRLVFSFNYNDSQKYGNTIVANSDSTLQLKTACDTAATAWMNEQISGKTTSAKVISDFVTLVTTEGYQVPSYYEYSSDTVAIATGTFSTGSESKSLTGPNITFSTKAKFAEMWTNNSNSASSWVTTQITRSGYNGNYASPGTKWNNTNYVTYTDPSSYLGMHPNTKIKVGSTSFATCINNQRLTFKGLNIIDSTDTNRKWSDVDGVEPITNGLWETGNCYVEADKEIAFNTTEGEDYSTDGTMYREDATYSDAHSKVNDIVVHNPVSTENATIIANDKTYDLRTYTSLAEGGDPATDEGSCPRDSSCQFSTLTCTTTPSQHTAECYTTVNTGFQHVGGLNAHVHTADCLSLNPATDFGYTGGYQHYTVPTSGYYELETWGAQGESISPYTGGLGGYTSGKLYLNAGTVLGVGVGQSKNSNGSYYPIPAPFGAVFGGYADVPLGGYGVYKPRYYIGSGGGGTDIVLFEKTVVSSNVTSQLVGSSLSYGLPSFSLSKTSNAYVEIKFKYMSSYSFTDYLYLSIGMTLSNGSIAGTGTFPILKDPNSYQTIRVYPQYTTGSSINAWNEGIVWTGASVSAPEGTLIEVVYAKVCYDNYSNKLNVSGGGGGSSWYEVPELSGSPANVGGLNGGSGGGLVGGSGLATGNITPATGGTQTANGYNPVCPPYYYVSNYSGYGGGGGFFPGGGSAGHGLYYQVPDREWTGSGAGGSSYVGSMTDTTIQQGVRSGNGYARISLLGYSTGCTNTPNTHVCTSACGQTTQKVLTCTDPHHYAAGEPWDYDDPNNHYDFGDLRCYTPCGDGDISMKQIAIGGTGISKVETEYGDAVKIDASSYHGAYVAASNVFQKDKTYVVAFDAWSTVEGDTIRSDAYPDTLPETSFTLTTTKTTYSWSLFSSSTDMSNAVLRFFAGIGGTAGDVYITNIRVGECAVTTAGHVHSASCIVSKHKNASNVVLPDGQVASTSDIFINLDREFKVYYPDMGDFTQSPNLHGISSCTNIRGMGYTDNMATSKWLREKYVTLPVSVIDANGKSHYAGEQINLLELPNNNGYYTFYCVLANHEAINAEVSYLSVGNNAPEIAAYSDNEDTTNRYRDTYLSASHSGTKDQVIDVVGYIGSLTLNDTGDFRFATLFKQVTNNGTWLIENLVPSVNYKLPNKVLSDTLDVRQETASASTIWHSAYQITQALTGGKAFQHISLPLTPAKNPITALQKQSLRPGYKLYMDIETVGDYYGENVDENNTPVDTDLYYKMQITPRYWELDLDTGTYTPVDVYMGVNGEYEPVVLFGNSTDSSEWIYYLDWLEESARRNYTAREKEASNSVVSSYSYTVPSQTIDGKTIPGYIQRTRLPITQVDPIGTANRLFLNDLNRTFIGASTTYGVSKNPDNYWNESYFARQSQRWHFTLGLPSSSVFVEAGKDCTEVNIETIQSHNSVIVCAIDVKVKGEVWTLEYDGTGINYSDGSGLKVTPNGSTYAPPTDSETGKPLDDPIVVVYSNKFTSKDDLRTEGTH